MSSVIDRFYDIIIVKTKLFFIKKDFDEEYYLRMNPDVKDSNIGAWKHFYKYGYYEGRKYKSKKYRYKSYGLFYKLMRYASNVIFRGKILKNKNVKIFIHVHLYYMDAWKEIKEYIKNLEKYDYDIIVTYTDVMKDENVIKDIKENGITVVEYPNRGFDVGSFMDIIGKIDSNKYDIIYHVHSKSVQPRRYVYGKLFVGKEWFTQLYKGILGLFNIHNVINILCENNNIGIICANNLIFQDNEDRIKLVKKFCNRYNINCNDNYKFAGGFCFAMRGCLIDKIKDLNIDINSFSYSRRGIFTLAHALERIIPIIIQNNGYILYGTPVFYKKHLKLIDAHIKNQTLQMEKPIKILSSYGFKDINVKSLDVQSGLKCRFFTAVLNNKKCFIKWGGVASICKNEYDMLSLCSKQSSLFLRPMCYQVSELYCFIATELLDGITLEQMMEMGIKKHQADKICDNIYNAILFLKNNNLIHRDIRPSNIFICNDGNVVILDAQFMVYNINGEIKELEYLCKNIKKREVLGDIYKVGKCKWDDMYSFELIKKEIYDCIICD